MTDAVPDAAPGEWASTAIRELRVRASRGRRVLSQEQFARQLGVTSGTVGRWERGEETPSPLARGKLDELAQKLADAGGPSAAKGE